ncbi:MAG: hypothetical protein OXB88_02755, partial [Bacteriovoracales bacterium]|nr:hypothetical protein [Bacteriovoracales bacterium]
PQTESRAAHKLYLEYDFRKLDVDSLGRVFNIDCWKMDDFIAESAYEIDPDISTHTDIGCKPSYRQYSHPEPNKQTYAAQVAWHALFITAGKLLSNLHVTKGYDEENSWDEWFSHYVLTREDGFWQSDTLDTIPLEIKTLLQEEKKGKLTLTKNPDVLLGLINLTRKIEKNIIVDGYWTSYDEVKVNISSALVHKRFSKKTIASLFQENPFQIWPPDLYDENEGNGLGRENNHIFAPWIFSTGSYRKLDEFDPYGASMDRDGLRIVKKIIDTYELSCTDKFKRYWNDRNGEIILKLETWNGSKNYDKEYSGLRLSCSKNFLKKLLKDYDSNLIVLIRLQQYVKRGFEHSSGGFHHSIGIVEINEKLEFKYHKGCNKESKTLEG